MAARVRLWAESLPDLGICNHYQMMYFFCGGHFNQELMSGEATVLTYAYIKLTIS